MFDNILSIFKPKAPQKHIKVLVIEDTEIDRRVACAAIERGGYTALKANDGKSGFELAKEQKPQLIILDYNLPDIKGPEVCKLLKAHLDTQQIPVLFLTSLTGPDNVIKCFEQGENYLAKPISVKLLLKQIDFALKNSQPQN
ncbi:MAG: response regulator [Candidatus Omnitrophica bacterium]|nr:response regulator [Candidatus Omnitrophota bacterium]